MKLSIITPDSLREEEAVKVFFPGLGGSFEVMDNHEPMLAALKAGIVSWVKKDGTKDEFAISAGFVKVKSNEVNAIVEKQ